MTCRHNLRHVSFASPDVRRGRREFALKLLGKLNFDVKVSVSVQYGICSITGPCNKFVFVLN